MANKVTPPLPISTPEYNQINDSLTRRQLEQTIQELNSQITLLKTMQESITSRSIKRHQFLLMGVN